MAESIRGPRVAAALALYWGFSACTTGGNEPSTSPSPGDPEPAPLLCADCEHLDGPLAGGESSEFSGGNPICAIAVSVPRPLSDPELAPLLGWVEGRHELSLRWRSNFATGAVSGYQEQTQIVVDVRVMGARDVTLVSGCAPADERLLDLAIDIATADGALRGTFTQTVRLLHGDDQFQTNLLQGDNPSYPLDNFRGFLDLDIDPAAPAGGVLIQLAFSPAGVRGRLMPYVSSAAINQGWVPIEGRFPDDGCGFDRWPVPLDRPMLSLNGETLLDTFQRPIDRWSGPIPAVWGNSGAQLGEHTQVSFDIGSPEQACQFLTDDSGHATNGFRLNAPLRVRSADGELDLSGTAVFDVSPPFSADGAYIRVAFDTPFIPVDEFLSLPGIGEPVPDAAARYAAPGLNLLYVGGAGFEGNFHVETWPQNGPNPGQQWLWW